MFIGLHVQYTLILLDSTKNLIFVDRFFNFHENSSSGGPSCYMR